jgi:hypothetical protein
MKWAQERRVELISSDRRVIYHLPDKDAFGLANYREADNIRKAELDRKWKRAFKKAFGVNPEPSKKNAPRGPVER